MRQLTTKETELIEKMDKLNENSEEYKELQKQLIDIVNAFSSNTLLEF